MEPPCLCNRQRKSLDCTHSARVDRAPFMLARPLCDDKEFSGDATAKNRR